MGWLLDDVFVVMFCVHGFEVDDFHIPCIARVVIRFSKIDKYFFKLIDTK